MNSYRKRSFSVVSAEPARPDLQELQENLIKVSPFSLKESLFVARTPRLAVLMTAIARKGPYFDRSIAHRGYFRQRVMAEVWQDVSVKNKNFIALQPSASCNYYYIVYQFLEPKGCTFADWIESVWLHKVLFDVGGSLKLLQACFLHIVFRFVLGVNEMRGASALCKPRDAVLHHVLVTPRNLTCSAVSYCGDGGELELLRDTQRKKSTLETLGVTEWASKTAKNAIAAIVVGSSAREMRIILQKCNQHSNWHRISELACEHDFYKSQADQQKYIDCMQARMQAVIDSM